MLFLVTGENIDPGYLVPPDQAANALEQAVVPSFRVLAEMARQGKLTGGVFPGERAGAFIIDVSSFEELDGIMNRLPFFGLVRWSVKPVMSFPTVAENLPEYLKVMRQGAGGPS